MTRTCISELKNHTGSETSISGWVTVRRDQGKMIFLDIRDGFATVQCVLLTDHMEAIEQSLLRQGFGGPRDIRSQWVLEIHGKVNQRPEKNVKAGVMNGDIELEVLEIKILSKAAELPFDLDAELNLDTHFDYLPLTLRTQHSRDIFTMQATIVEAYRASLRAQKFMEFQAPALVGGDAEGGAAAFKVEYFYDQTAYLATSPQFYKQIMVGPFERAFTIAKIFRAEKSATSRHISELTQMDFEMGFIKDHTDVMAVLENVIRDVVKTVADTHADIFERFKITAPLVADTFPVFTLREAQEIVSKETGIDSTNEPDMEPEHERVICAYAKEKLGSDFVFITHYPTKKRAFYTYADPTNPELSLSFDLLFRGLEINSGSQRIHDYEQMLEKIKSRGLDPEKFSFYLQAFKYGMPPHGGCSTGLERLTARMLELPNVKEASAFPRDLNRIDKRLSE